MTNYPDIIVPTCGSPDELSPLMSEMQGFSLGCRSMATCQNASAAKNRNIGLEWAKSPIVIMLDDDIGGFFGGWWKTMVKPLEENKDIVLVSARLLKPDRSNGLMMYNGDQSIELSAVPRVPTACIAFRNDGIRFDDGSLIDSLDEEGYIGSGFEDDDFCARIQEKYPGGKVVINNTVKLVHFNEMKNQNGPVWERNQKYFDTVWITVGHYRIRRKRPPFLDEYWGIPKIIHFVWIGPEMPDWAQKNIAEFKRLNPDFTVKIHDEKDLNPVFSELWDRITHPVHSLAMKSDLIRLSVLLADGGWFFDCDFWPLVSLSDMCKGFVGAHRRTTIFASEDRKIVANGAIGCRADDPGLHAIVKKLMTFKGRPDWWDYGTMVFFQCVSEHPELFCLNDLKKVIPYTGKQAAKEVMSSQEKIEATAAAGAWAIHFEMKTTTDF
jgi:glycosyltransferase involved in cell wall biosynthesis